MLVGGYHFSCRVLYRLLQQLQVSAFFHPGGGDGVTAVFPCFLHYHSWANVRDAKQYLRAFLTKELKSRAINSVPQGVFFSLVTQSTKLFFRALTPVIISQFVNLIRQVPHVFLKNCVIRSANFSKGVPFAIGSVTPKLYFNCLQFSQRLKYGVFSVSFGIEMLVGGYHSSCRV